MSAYLQMGHDSVNLITEGIEDFGGVILSPVNCAPHELAHQVSKISSVGKLDIVFDPQLYYPSSERGSLPNYSYFPSDFETADRHSESFWKKVIEDVCITAEECGANAICSPIYIPKKYDPKYIDQCNRNFEMLRGRSTRSRPILTVCLPFNEFDDVNDSFRLSSKLTQAAPTEIYVILTSEVKPRRELNDRGSLLGLMAFIRSLENAGCNTIISHSSSELILLKAAGASHCASGKYFNLRRFTSGRFKESGESGGKNITYWFEQGLMAFLRQADIIRIMRDGIEGVLRQGESDNDIGRKFMAEVGATPGEKLLGLSWRQYLSWFGRMEAELSKDDRASRAKRVLAKAQTNWQKLDQKRVRMDESENNGSWIADWQSALDEFIALEY